MTHPSRRLRPRIIAVLFALFCLLSAQLSLAAYACPNALVGSQQAAAMDMQGMPCAGDMAGDSSSDVAGDVAAGMDAEQPAMCHAHCKTIQQSADQYHVPTLATIMQMGPVLTLAQPTAVIAQASPWQASILKRTTAPPIAVRHCCLRV